MLASNRREERTNRIRCPGSSLRAGQLRIDTAACYLALGLRLVVAARDIGTVPMGVLFFVISAWVVGGAIELMASTYFVFAIGRTCHFVGTALLPLAAYFCFREYTGRKTSAHRLVMLALIPIVSITLAATNYFHEFMWYLPVANAQGDIVAEASHLVMIIAPF